jgi:type II secretory pathway pseudopilin PulG
VNARRRGTPGSARPGVSLIEVLLATAIFLISIAAIGVLMRSASDNALDTARTNLCSQLARSKMAELEAGLGDVTLSPGNTSGTFEDRPNYQWEIICTQISVGSGGVASAYDVTVRVWIDTGGGRPTEVSLSQVLLDPYLMNNAAPITAPDTTTSEIAP